MNDHYLLPVYKVALVVGVVLNLINQGNAFIHFDITHLDFIKFVLTFLVPFGVSVYSSVIIRLKIVVGKRARINAKVKCVSCGDISIDVKEDELIEKCPKCGEKTKYKIIEIK
ncbi:MAG: nitrate/nitrite transporter NrtS [Bacteroidetes bacterium]|nr:nitrate/nitrite transporter NrtS [Bacteroidota bacterium]